LARAAFALGGRASAAALWPTNRSRCASFNIFDAATWLLRIVRADRPGMPDNRPYNRVEASLAQGEALATLERGAGQLTATQADRVERLITDTSNDPSSFMARWITVHGAADYTSAFGKILSTGDAGAASVIMSDAERAVVYDSYRLRQERAQSESNASGGYAVPVFIDPSIILTDQGSPNAFLSIARTVDITTNAWKGVSSAGMTWPFDTEASEVSDDSLTSITQPSVTVFMARGFIPYSIEIEQDWPGFQTEMAGVLASGYDELLVSKFTSGNGTSEPRGILTALTNASPTVTVTSTTDGAFGQEDVYATWAALPARFRSRASWMMSVSAMNRVRAFGDASHWHAVTVQLPQNAIDKLFERPVYEGPYFDDITTLTTGAQNRLVVGDFSQYVIARRCGLQIELVPHLLATANNRPSGSRGFFAFARVGGNSVTDNGFRIQRNL
jgi:HK97 family phage major capsid protein